MLLPLARWTQSATGIPVHCSISSVQRLRGLPRHLFPAMVPCRICVHRLSARTTWPNYCNLDSVDKRPDGTTKTNLHPTKLGKA